MKRSIETEHKSVWEDLFESKKYVDVKDYCIVSIEQNGQVSKGIVRLFSSPIADNKEILLEYSSEIQEYFDFDAELENKDNKYFGVVLYEYLDLTNGIKITFYDSAKYKHHVLSHRRNREKDVKEATSLTDATTI